MKRETYSVNDLAILAKVDPLDSNSIVFNKYSEINSFIDCLFEHALSYFFITDYRRMNYLYLSKSVSNVLGYSQKLFMNRGLEFTFNCIHPDDRLRLKQIHEKMFQFYYRTPVFERKDLKFSVNYRVKRADEKYITLLQETIFTDISFNGHPIADFSTSTDISSHKKETHLKLTIYKKRDASYNQVYEYMVNDHVDLLTNRQVEILNLLSKGLTTSKIAEKLFLSEETVKIHRKNILLRTGAKNSIQAVNILMSGELVG